MAEWTTVYPDLPWVLPEDGSEQNIVLNRLAAVASLEQALALGDGEDWGSVQGALCAKLHIQASSGTRAVAMAIVATRRLLAGSDVRELMKLLSRSTEEREGVLVRMSDQSRGIARRALEVLEHVVVELVAAGGLPEGRSGRNAAVAQLVRFIITETSKPAALKAAFQAGSKPRELVEGALLEEALRRIEEAKRAEEAERAKAVAVPTVVEKFDEKTRAAAEAIASQPEPVRQILLGAASDVVRRAVDFILHPPVIPEKEKEMEPPTERGRTIAESLPADQTVRGAILGGLADEIREEVEYALEWLAAQAQREAVVETPVVVEPEGPSPEELKAEALKNLDRELGARRRHIREELKKGTAGASDALSLIEAAIGSAQAQGWVTLGEVLNDEWATLVEETSRIILPFFANEEPDSNGAWLELIGDGWSEGAADAVVVQVAERVRATIEEAEEELTRPEIVVIKVPPAEPRVIDYELVLDLVLEGEPLPSVGELAAETEPGEGEAKRAELSLGETPPEALTGPFAAVEWPEEVLARVRQGNPAGTNPRSLLVEAVEAGITKAVEAGRENQLHSCLQRAFREIPGVGGKTADKLVPLVFQTAKEIFRGRLATAKTEPSTQKMR